MRAMELRHEHGIWWWYDTQAISMVCIHTEAQLELKRALEPNYIFLFHRPHTQRLVDIQG